MTAGLEVVDAFTRRKLALSDESDALGGPPATTAECVGLIPIVGIERMWVMHGRNLHAPTVGLRS